MGEIGFITTFANYLVTLNQDTDSEAIKNHFKKFEKWDEFVSVTLKETNDLEKVKQLGGPTNGDPTDNSESDK